MARQGPFKRLLVVEDDPDQCRALRDRLELYGYADSCAEDGSTAMQMLEADSFHGVLLDLNLPSISGHEVLAQARQAFPALPVLIMLMWLIVQLGLVFRAMSGIQHGLGEGARMATLFPKPADEAIHDRIEAAVYGIGPGNFVIEDPVNGTADGIRGSNAACSP